MIKNMVNDIERCFSSLDGYNEDVKKIIGIAQLEVHMKIKRFLIVFTFITALFLVVSTLNISSASAIVAKKTPNGLQKTPGAMATQNAINHAAGIYGNPHGKPVNYQGIITTIDDVSITITLKDQSSVTVTITPETIIRFPRGQASEDQLLTPGMTVMVHAILGQDDLLTARRINLIPKASPLQQELDD
ncbi:MAG: hypothetical protein CVU42_09575 [Chloroflexi bacterium HGW-Chloroflexi-4]|nr:MAG: hypothetical protein CVU42_09575 [Chloroflexi bacterium HGW-Chloroflexi-4]